MCDHPRRAGAGWRCISVAGTMKQVLRRRWRHRVMRGRSRILVGALALLLSLWLGLNWRPLSRPIRDTEVSERPAVHGLVRDLEGPLPGARVRFQGEAAHVTTDAQGLF